MKAEKMTGIPDSAVELRNHHCGAMKSDWICQHRHTHGWGPMAKTELHSLTGG